MERQSTRAALVHGANGGLRRSSLDAGSRAKMMGELAPQGGGGTGQNTKKGGCGCAIL